MKKFATFSTLITAMSLAMVGFHMPFVVEQHTVQLVHDNFGVPMVYVPGGTTRIGATLDKAVSKCEELRIKSNSPRIGYCRVELSQSVPDGVSYFVKPIEEISIEDYFIDQYEVTIQSYLECVFDEVCSGDVIQYMQGNFPYQPTTEAIRSISYPDAELYCHWRGGYIPSETEWEYASRGPLALSFPWGDEFDGSKLNFCDSNCASSLANRNWNDGYAEVSPVTAYALEMSWVGAKGMAGNVSEWTSTIYVGETPYSSDIPRRVVKGGEFASTADQTLLWRRLPLGETEIRDGIGFRCAKKVEAFKPQLQIDLIKLALILIQMFFIY